MIILSYDIADDRLRNHFSKYITKFGHRIQYSVYQIDNSNRVLDNIISYIQDILKRNLVKVTVYTFLSYPIRVKLLGWGMLKMRKKDLVIF